tara:strand:- start:811 stop:1008 length:198 start_codon:yes stop_codon:yes gene_type:complete
MMYLDESVQRKLREQNIISENEVLTQEGDLFVAINVLSQDRRIVTLSESTIFENDVTKKPQLLKG